MRLRDLSRTRLEKFKSSYPKWPKRTEFDALRSLAMFSGVPEHEIGVALEVEERNVDAGAVIYQPGETLTHLLVVVSGVVELTTAGEDAEDAERRLLQPGALLGEAQFLLCHAGCAPSTLDNAQAPLATAKTSVVPSPSQRARLCAARGAVRSKLVSEQNAN
jgi:hypothetical protein